MDPLAQTHDLVGLLAVALALGMRHGVDADHLAAIDAMARFNALDRPRLARRSGLWFSLGHGAVVLAMAVSLSLMSRAWTLPAWLESFGAWASIAILVLLGLMNLDAVRRAPPGSAVAATGWRSGLFARVLKASGPWPMLAVGALFAVSFDTFGQAALMAAAGTTLRGLAAVFALAGAFVAGMLVTDGLNGWWMARLLRRSDGSTARASRIVCIGVVGVSFGTALLGAGARLSAAFGTWAQAHEASFGWLIVAVMALSFLLGAAVTPARACALEPAPSLAGRAGAAPRLQG